MGVARVLFYIYLLWGGGATAIQVAFLCFFAETQDDLEAITNEIKKMANNARNKLKSESDTRGSSGALGHSAPNQNTLK